MILLFIIINLNNSSKNGHLTVGPSDRKHHRHTQIVTGDVIIYIPCPIYLVDIVNGRGAIFVMTKIKLITSTKDNITYFFRTV